MEVAKYNELAAKLKQTLNLRTYPIGIKFFENLEDVPEGAIWPKRDLGKPAAFCQATAMARMRGQMIAQGKEDHWCWNPLVAFGMVSAEVGTPAGDLIIKVLGIEDREKAVEFWKNFPMLPLGKYNYVVVAPVETCTFEPDVIMIYSDTEQMLWEIGAVRFMTGQYINSQFDAIDSCIHAIIEVMESGEYKITFPDPGDHARANARENEVIMSFAAERFEEFCTGVDNTAMMYGNLQFQYGLELQNPVPPFYHELFQMWGIEDEIPPFTTLTLFDPPEDME